LQRPLQEFNGEGREQLKTEIMGQDVNSRKY